MQNRNTLIQCDLNLRSETVECRILSADNGALSVQFFTTSPVRVATMVSFAQTNRSAIDCIIAFIKLTDQPLHLRINEADIADLQLLFSGSAFKKIRTASRIVLNLTIELARLRASYYAVNR